MGTCSVAETRVFAVWVQVKPTVGVGFTGTGAGWTMPTHTIPMCHPTCQTAKESIKTHLRMGGTCTVHT